MHAAKTIAVAAFSLVLLGCAEPMVWNKSGASQADFNTDRYRCMQESQQQSSSAYVNRYGGYASSGQTTNESLFNACMTAQGWSLGRDNSTDAKAAMKDFLARAHQNCADPKYAPYYGKTACRASDITLGQVTDTSTISPAEKAIFLEVRNRLDATNREYTSLLRQYGGAVGRKRAVAIDAFAPRIQQNNLDLYEGRTTWGEYNKRRQQIYRETQAAENSITS